MEPQNAPLKDYFPLQLSGFQIPCLSSRAYTKVCFLSPPRSLGQATNWLKSIIVEPKQQSSRMRCDFSQPFTFSRSCPESSRLPQSSPSLQGLPKKLGISTTGHRLLSPVRQHRRFAERCSVVVSFLCTDTSMMVHHPSGTTSTGHLYLK